MSFNSLWTNTAFFTQRQIWTFFFNFPIVWKLPDNSLTEQSDSTETHSSSEVVLGDETPTDQSEGFTCGEKQAAGVADAALQDGEEGAESCSFLYFIMI